MTKVKLEETKGQRRLHIGSYFTDLNETDYQELVRIFSEKSRQAAVSGSASDFERKLYKLINAYVSAGLNKPDLVNKMEYVTQSCRVS